MRRPGDRLLRIAERVCAPRTLQRLIVPTIADLQAEYEEAVRAERPWRRRWVWVTGHLALLRVVAVHGASCAIGIVRDVTGEDRRPALRAVAASSVVILIGTALLAAPIMLRFVPAGHPRAPEMVLFLIPQALPLSIPVGLTFGILWALGRARVSGRSRHAVLALVLYRRQPAPAVDRPAS